MNVLQQLKETYIKPLVEQRRQDAFSNFESFSNLVRKMKGNINTYKSYGDKSKVPEAKIQEIQEDFAEFSKTYQNVSNIIEAENEYELPFIFSSCFNAQDAVEMCEELFDKLENNDITSSRKPAKPFRFFEKPGKVSADTTRIIETFNFDRQVTSESFKNIPENIVACKNIIVMKNILKRQIEFEQEPKIIAKLKEIETKIEQFESIAAKEEDAEEKAGVKTYSNLVEENGVVRSGTIIVKVKQEALTLLSKNPTEFWKGCEEIAPSAFEGLDFSGVKIHGGNMGSPNHFSLSRAGYSPSAQLRIPSSVKTIGSRAFKGCKGLKSVQTVAEDVKKQAFADNADLEIFFISGQPMNFGTGVFAGTKLSGYTSAYGQTVGTFQLNLSALTTDEMEKIFGHITPYSGFYENDAIPENLIKDKIALKAKAGDSLSFITENKGKSAGKGGLSKEKSNGN